MQEGDWLWDANGVHLGSAGYTNWAEGEPNNYEGGENCAQLNVYQSEDDETVSYWNVRGGPVEPKASQAFTRRLTPSLLSA